VATPPPPDAPEVRTADLVTDRFDEADDELTDRSRMSFLEHLDELRRRILYSIYALVAACCVTFWYAERMFTYLLAYFHRSIPMQGQLIFTEPMAGFMFWFKVGIFAGLILASPFMFAQLWFFVAPGLYTREKKVVIPFVVCSTLLFLSGAAFSHFVAFPMMWTFFGTFARQDLLAFMPNIDVTFGFYMKMVLAIGLVFQMPMLVFFLARFGIVTSRFLLVKFKYAVLIIFIAAAIITPSSDMVSQTVLAAPMLVLYVISIGVAWAFGKKKREPEDAD